VNYKASMLLGRLSDGFQSDHGVLVHAVVTKLVKPRPCPWNDWGRDATKMAQKVEAEVGMCGARPGRRSVGWSHRHGTDKPGELKVNCPRCLKKIAKEVP
jgi:hypothetical protein